MSHKEHKIFIYDALIIINHGMCYCNWFGSLLLQLIYYIFALSTRKCQLPSTTDAHKEIEIHIHIHMHRMNERQSWVFKNESECFSLFLVYYRFYAVKWISILCLCLNWNWCDAIETTAQHYYFVRTIYILVNTYVSIRKFALIAFYGSLWKSRWYESKMHDLS